MKNLLMSPAERLKYIRKQTGLSQQKFAALLGEKPSRINSIESGKQVNFPYSLAEKILEAFPENLYSFKWITTGEGEPREKQSLSPEEKKHLEKAEKIIDRLLNNITDAELDLVAECLIEHKELTVLLLKKLKSDEKAVKRFLLE